MARAEDFERIATETVTGLLAEVAETTGHAATANVSLEYLGQYTQRTGAITKSANRIVPQRSKIVFMLQADANGTTTCHVLTARCDHVIQRACVPLPPIASDLTKYGSRVFARGPRTQTATSQNASTRRLGPGFEPLAPPGAGAGPPGVVFGILGCGFGVLRLLALDLDI